MSIAYANTPKQNLVAVTLLKCDDQELHKIREPTQILACNLTKNRDKEIQALIINEQTHVFRKLEKWKIPCV